MTVTERVQKMLEEIGSDVTLVGATKYQPQERIREAISAGLRHLGVNQAQAGEALMESLSAPTSVQWHFIGQIQSRKVKFLPNYQWVHSLDRWEVAEKLNDRLGAVAKKLSVLVEINLGNEPQKPGITLEALPEFLNRLPTLNNLKVRGLMGMPPPLEPEARRPYFKQLRQAFEQCPFDTLSMGTSQDYRQAIEEGATMIRVGTELFGPRE